MTKLSKSEILKMRIKRIEKEIRDTPYHKGTEHHIGRLKAKLSSLRTQVEDSDSRKTGGGGGYALKKQGDATVILIGPPSVGKSTLINKLTNARSKIAPYAFTTLTVIPGMMKYRSADIQILDVPGIIARAQEGKGRGREVLSVARGADLVIIITDIDNLEIINEIKTSLYDNGIRLDTNPTDVTIEKKLKGGVIIHSNITQELSQDTIREVASEFGYKNADVTLRERLSMETLIDAFSRNRIYIPSISVINKVDTLEEISTLDLGDEILPISAEENLGLEELKETVWKSLGFIRVYLVKIDEEPNDRNPIVMKLGDTLTDLVEKLGSDFSENKTKAKIWGPGAKFPGQIVSLTKVIEEGMMVRFL